MSNYRWSIYEPDDPKVIEMGSIRKEEIMETFEQFSWIDRLRRMAGMKEDAICFSPSLEFKNLDTEQGVSFSIVGTESDHEFYIFYTRPSLSETRGMFDPDEDYQVSDLTGQTKEDAVKFLNAFLNNDTVYLEEKIKNR